MADRQLPCAWQPHLPPCEGVRQAGADCADCHRRKAIRDQVRAGRLPAVESNSCAIEQLVEPEPAGVVQHTTKGGRGAVARLREDPTR